MLKNRIIVLGVVVAMFLSTSAFVSTKDFDKHTAMDRDDVLSQPRTDDHVVSNALYNMDMEGESLTPLSTPLKLQVDEKTAISTAEGQNTSVKWDKISLIYKGNTPIYAIFLNNGTMVEVNGVTGKIEDTEYITYDAVTLSNLSTNRYTDHDPLQ